MGTLHDPSDTYQRRRAFKKIFIRQVVVLAVSLGTILAVKWYLKGAFDVALDPSPPALEVLKG